MIKLNKTQPAPSSLSSPACINTLTAIQQKIDKGQEVKSEDYKSLYAQQDVKDTLKNDQNTKCAYCEKSLVDEQKHVEHYRPKKRYPKLAFTWDNLLGSCWACNLKKRNEFPLVDEKKRYTPQEKPLLLNPYYDDPAEYFEFHEEEIHPKRGISPDKRRRAEFTIKVILDRADLKDKRRKTWNYYQSLRSALDAMVGNVPMDKVDDLQRTIDALSLDTSEFAGMFRYQD